MLLPRQGASLGQYELLRVIGSGGMGVVYEAHQQALGRRVAVKVLHPVAPGARRADVVPTRFLREGRAAAQVRHDHVVDVFDFGVHDGTPFLVMELVEGESLAERIEREGALPLALALELLLPMFSAVGALHAAGIIHRDLKPANILLGRGRLGDVFPKLVDFGVSRVDDDAPGLTESGVVVGSYPYMPPEQARGGREVTEYADQYSLGAVLYECVTGARPFEGDTPYDLTHAILHAPLVLPSQRNAALPKALDAVLARALSRDAEARFACVEDFGAALLPLAAPHIAARWAGELVGDAPSDWTGTIPPVSPSPTRAAQPTRRFDRAAIGAVAIACIGLVGAMALHTQSAAHGETAASTPALARPEPLGSVSSAAVVDVAPEAARAQAEPAPTTSARAAAIAVRTKAPAPALPAPAKSSAAATPKPAPAPAKHDEAPAFDNGAPLLDPR